MLYNYNSMAKKTRNKEVYRMLDEFQQEYIRIYHTYFVLQWEIYEICEHFQCSPSKVTNAIQWVIKNKTKFAPEYLLDGAIYACRERLKQNRKLLDEELQKQSANTRDKKFIIELNNQIRMDEDRLFKLQQVILGNSEDDNESINAADVLKLISAASKDKQ